MSIGSTLSYQPSSTDSEVPDVSRPISWSFLAWFAALFMLLYVGYALIPEPLLRDQIYFHGITEPAQRLLHWLVPHLQATAVGNHLQSARVDLSIVRGCDGAGVVLLLVAAIVAQRVSLTHTLLGTLGAVVLLYLINEARILALFLVASYAPSRFALFHVYWIPTLMVVLAAIYFAAWNSCCQTHARFTAQT